MRRVTEDLPPTVRPLVSQQKIIDRFLGVLEMVPHRLVSVTHKPSVCIHLQATNKLVLVPISTHSFNRVGTELLTPTCLVLLSVPDGWFGTYVSNSRSGRVVDVLSSEIELSNLLGDSYVTFIVKHGQRCVVPEVVVQVVYQSGLSVQS